MTTIHNLGFPRIGAKRELKFALEAYWKGESTRQSLEDTVSRLRAWNWDAQAQLDFVPVGDFSYYDHILDTSITVGNIPNRVVQPSAESSHPLDTYFQIARGRSAPDAGRSVRAGEMTKWFDTNYHYIVPEFTSHTEFALDLSRLESEMNQAKKLGVKSKPVLIGPLTYLMLGKTRDDSSKLGLLPRLLAVYEKLLEWLAALGAEWVQIDEPILVTEFSQDWQDGFITAYSQLNSGRIKTLIATYFGPLLENLPLMSALPVQGIHIDAINAREEVDAVLADLRSDQILSLGVINGRNIWKTDLNSVLDWLEPIYEALGERLWLAPSCSLLHVPVDLDSERRLDKETRSWLAFAVQKLGELRVLGKALSVGRDSVSAELLANLEAVTSRRNSIQVNNPAVSAAVSQITAEMSLRTQPYSERSVKQAAILKLPMFPTTTIGSFPQTTEIRQVRRAYRKNEIDEESYCRSIRSEIEMCVREQESLSLDVLVHGEAERNDMVEYFGEQLEGFVFTQYGWVQSYGSRCVKPPVIFGDISRPNPMTVHWITFAQSLTKKPMKGMLTGPVTILNWSFVRDDQPRSVTCYQIALAIRKEVLDLEQAGVRIIQIDEAALREGLPLRRSQWDDYLRWAVDSFRLAANGVRETTQIHTHMCYSEFNEIIPFIAQMDADVITIETSRSNMELLGAFDDFSYPNEIGPGVYDIHSPNIPTRDQMVQLMRKASECIRCERLWVNPDCGLKTRAWAEVIPALKNMVAAAQELRQSECRGNARP